MKNVITNVVVKHVLILTLLMFASFATAATTSSHPVSQKLRVILDWFPNPDHAPLVIANQQGFFKDHGLEVEMISPKNPNDAAKWVSSGKADIGVDYQTKLVRDIDKGMPLVQIGTLIDKPLDCLIALKTSKINTISDLKGKRIGIGEAGFSHISLKIMLNQGGLEEGDVKMINVGENPVQALLNNKVDAVIGIMRNFEVPELELSGHPVSVFFPEEHGVKTYSELVFIANKKQVLDKRFPRFLAAIKEATAYLDAHPEETWKKFIAEYPESNNEVNKGAWFATMPYFSENPETIDQDEWRQFAELMYKNNLIKKINLTTQKIIG